ncbi:putative C2 domain-containing protein [Phytophthora cinnamomi]|uniref:putative C2 domain-containing protein n=1 Tax=Phytophthora cinnamomi TaxID=4785 RepID=UPI00355A087D|nr:putative C2 domain-containing protein [Phytophthora cinnamomi]
MPYLHVTLFSAEDLPASDSILVGGKSDPYVVFKVGKTEHRSLCHKRNLNPEWSPPERYTFHVENPTTAVLSIKIFDMDFLMRDDLLGTIVLPVAKFEDSMGVSTLEYYPVSVPNAFSKQNCQSTLKLEICLKSTRDDDVEKRLHVWENQSRSFRSGWQPATTSARQQWSSHDNSLTSSEFKNVVPTAPIGMTGSGWELCIAQGDGEGWLYAKSASGPWSSSSTTLTRVRRRLWENVYRLEGSTESPISDC